MAVGVVQIRKVRMPMHQFAMTVRVQMRLLAVPGEIVFVLMVHVMDMGVSVLDRLVRVFVIVALGQMQPHAGRHEERAQ